MRSAFHTLILLLCLAQCVNAAEFICIKNSGRQHYINSRDGSPAGLNGLFWSFKLIGGKTLTSDYFVQNGRVSHEFTSDSSLRFTYEDALNKVILTISLCPLGVDCELNFEILEEDVCEVSMPASMDFGIDNLIHVIYPNEMGVKLKRSFYEEQTTSKIWESRTVGTEPLRMVAGISCLIDPNPDRISKVQVTEFMSRFLDPKLTKKWEENPRLVVRSSVEKPTYNFIESENGCFWGGHRVGHGILLRWGGKLMLADESYVTQTVAQTIAALKEGRIEGYDPHDRQNIGLLSINGCPPSTGWSEISVEQWQKSPVGMLPNFVTVTSIDDAIAFMMDKSSLALINPYGEFLPAGNIEYSEVLARVKKYLTSGGLWVETGGYPFYNLLQPARYNSIASHYPIAFSDIFHINTTAGNLSFYGIQPDSNFVPMHFRTWADSAGGHISRTWEIYIYKTETKRTPVMRLAMNRDFRGVITEYAAANGFTRGLSEKMPPWKLEKWKHAPIMKFSGSTINEQTNQIKHLPRPSIVHVWNYLKGGFDKLYPEHLPPHPRQGTMQDFEAMIDVTHKKGHLFMPYTNNTWWCDDPAPEILKRAGGTALLKTSDGTTNKEIYGANHGWSISPWHPEVVESSRRITREFTGLGCDILFEDQVGAREWIHQDFNPASPSPDAYHQGLINLAREVSASVPVSTEHGYDRLINAESEFCGLSWMLVPFKERPRWLSFWLRSYADLFDQQSYEAFPLAQYVTGGKTFFTHHLGGPLVENSENLAWTLLLGYQIIIDMPTTRKITKERWRWINYLAGIQRLVALEYMGEPMLDFEYLDGSGNRGVVRSRFDNVEIVANFTQYDYTYKDCTIAPNGFLAVTNRRTAGYVSAYGNKKYSQPTYINTAKKLKPCKVPRRVD